MTSLSGEKGVYALLSQSPRNALLGKSFISIKADKTSNDSVKNSRGVSKAPLCVYFCETIKTEMIRLFCFLFYSALRSNDLQEQNQKKCSKKILLFLNGSLFYSLMPNMEK